MADRSAPLAGLEQRMTGCRRCPRLVEWREQVARERKPAFRDEDYWGRPVPGFGDHGARLVLVGLAPAAHGANRTGRMFTGDRSGDWLIASLFRTGFASQPTSRRRGDGLRLVDCYMTAPVHCAPPANRPTVEELATCTATWLVHELRLLSSMRVVVALGGVAFSVMARLGPELGWGRTTPGPRFGHGVEVRFPAGGPVLLGSYHPSQQNTFTGRLTVEMLDAVFSRAREIVEAGQGG